MSSERPPSRDELLAMAWVDGELAPEARAQFEARLGREPHLRTEVAAQQRLFVLAREVAPPEPLELEWERMSRTPYARTLAWSGWILLVVGIAGLLGFGEFEFLSSTAPLTAKVCASMIGLGLVILGVRAFSMRRATHHLDPYRDLKR